MIKHSKNVILILSLEFNERENARFSQRSFRVKLDQLRLFFSDVDITPDWHQLDSIRLEYYKEN
jgi:hypothetical protein